MAISGILAKQVVRKMCSTPSESLVFVYGTLKKGQPNHPVMLDPENGTAKFVCRARTVEKFPLVIASQYNIPYLLREPSQGKQIYGEIYAVNSKMLDILDQFEGHPTYYTRHQIEVNPIEHQEATLLTPWVYFINRYKPEMLTRPMMDNYDSYGPHGLPYVESESLDNCDGI